MLKRCIDVMGAALGLLLLSPLLVLIALLVLFNFGWPIFYFQQRTGFRDRPFWIVKFRTMREIQDAEGRPLDDADRLTGFGRALRASSLDELPELWNVLLGEMSLVGPRPLHARDLTALAPEQAVRHQVRPGITGWAQVNGRNSISSEMKFVYDVWYVRNHTLWLDLRILLATIKTVANGRGVAKPEHGTVEEHRGAAGVPAGPENRSPPLSP